MICAEMQHRVRNSLPMVVLRALPSCRIREALAVLVASAGKLTAHLSRAGSSRYHRDMHSIGDCVTDACIQGYCSVDFAHARRGSTCYFYLPRTVVSLRACTANKLATGSSVRYIRVQRITAVYCSHLVPSLFTAFGVYLYALAV